MGYQKFVWNPEKINDDNFKIFLDEFENSIPGRSASKHFFKPVYVERDGKDILVFEFLNDDCFDEFVDHVPKIKGWHPDFITWVDK
ncbi:MAG: hypothetical protein JW737_00240 [Acidobacteria bacterium]|nr:hypothetical protein [Acidobacteriota bacterium]